MKSLGHREGYARGRREVLATNVLAVLKARGIEAVLDSAEDRALFGALPVEALMAVAMTLEERVAEWPKLTCPCAVSG